MTCFYSSLGRVIHAYRAKNHCVAIHLTSGVNRNNQNNHCFPYVPIHPALPDSQFFHRNEVVKKKKSVNAYYMYHTKCSRIFSLP